MKYCINCGTQLDDDAKFCHSCGTATEPTAAQPVAAPAAESATAPAPAQPTERKSGKAKLLNMRDKTAKFEKKHSLIVNLLVLCCSFIVLMVSLFAPIKVSGYAGIIRNSDIMGYGEASDGGSEYVYIEVDQTIFDMIGAIFYAIPDSSSAKINAEMNSELNAAYQEFRLWRSAHTYASETEMYKAYAEIYGKHISNTNYLGYILANTAPFEQSRTDVIDSLVPSDETESSEDIHVGLFASAGVSVVLGLVIAILAIVMAIMSLINLIKAIVGLCKKKTSVKFDKYMLRMLALSGVALTLMWVSPLLSIGGGMLGISVFIATVLLVTSVLRSLFVRGDNWLGVIKRGVTALLCMLAFYLLCGNIFIFRSYGSSFAISTHVKPGYAFHNIYNMIDMGDISSSSLRIATYIVGFVMFLFTAGFIMSFVYKSFSRAIRNVVKGGEGKPAPGLMIAAAVLTLVGLVFGLLSGTMIDMISKQSGGSSGSAKWLLSGHVWTSLVFLIFAIVLHFAFKPESICKGKTMTVLPALEAEPVPAVATADGATVAAPTEAVNNDTTNETETPAEEPVAEEAAEPVAEEPATEEAAEPVAEEPASEQADNGAQAE